MNLTVILPTLNEAAIVGPALERLRRQSPVAEVLLVDGGSADGTVQIAEAHCAAETRCMAEGHCKVLSSQSGRARQLNLGANAARGEWLLFLHADTRLPGGFEAAIGEAALHDCGAGVFSLRISGRHPLLPLLSLGANLRTRLWRIFLGDQALFIRKSLFLELGGFPELPLLEDYAFARLLKRKGERLYMSPLRVETSGRRWDEGGFFRTWWQFRRIFLRYHLFGDTQGLAPEYDNIRKPG